jgi:hypothetical protein
MNQSLTFLLVCPLLFSHIAIYLLILFSYQLTDYLALPLTPLRLYYHILLFDENKLHIIFSVHFLKPFVSVFCYFSFWNKFKKSWLFKNNKNWIFLVEHISSGRNKLFHKCEFFYFNFSVFSVYYYYRLWRDLSSKTQRMYRNCSYAPSSKAAKL